MSGWRAAVVFWLAPGFAVWGVACETAPSLRLPDAGDAPTIADAGAADDAPTPDAGAATDASADLAPAPVLLTGAAAESALACSGESAWSRADGGADAGDPGASGVWSLRFGDQSRDHAIAVAAGPDGTSFLLSSQALSVDFGEGPLAVTDCASFLSAFSASGAHRWSRPIGSFLTWPEGLVVGPDGGALVIFTGGTIARLAPDGTARWVRTVDGFQGGTLRLRNGSLFSELVGDPPIRFEKLALDGTTIWSFTMPINTGADWDVSVAGEVVFGPTFYANLTIGTGTFAPKAGGEDIIVGKLDASGRLAWVRQFGSPGYDRLADIVVSADDSIVLLGEASEALDFGAGPLGPGTSQVGFLARLDARGVIIGARSWTTPSLGLWLRELPSGQLLIAGDFSSPVDVEGTMLHTGAPGDEDFLVALTSPSFEVQKLWHFGNGGGTQRLWDIAVDDRGAMLVAGDFQGKLDLGSGAMTSAGDYDVFLGKVSP